jgi:hypothetical protein
MWGRSCACEILIANPINWLYAACLEYFILFSIDSGSCYARLYLCQRPFYKIFLKFKKEKNVLKIVLIIVNINEDENKSLISIEVWGGFIFKRELI